MTALLPAFKPTDGFFKLDDHHGFIATFIGLIDIALLLVYQNITGYQPVGVSPTESISQIFGFLTRKIVSLPLR